MKILIMPNKLSGIDDFKEASGFIVGIKEFSYLIPLEISIGDLKILAPKIKANNQEIFISLNKLMYNQDIPLLEEYLLTIDKLGINGILYDDTAILNLSLSLKLKTPLIWFGIHSFTSHYTANYWYQKGVKGGLLSTEITLNHIKEISKKTDMFLMMYGYGYLPMFVSRRLLLSSYFEYLKDSKDDKIYHMYEESRKSSYPTYETSDGTVILSSDIINVTEELPIINACVDYLVLSSLNIPSKNFKKIYNHYLEALKNMDSKTKLNDISIKVRKDSPARTDKGFLYKETIYRVKNDGE